MGRTVQRGEVEQRWSQDARMRGLDQKPPPIHSLPEPHSKSQRNASENHLVCALVIRALFFNRFSIASPCSSELLNLLKEPHASNALDRRLRNPNFFVQWSYANRDFKMTEIGKFVQNPGALNALTCSATRDHCDNHRGRQPGLPVVTTPQCSRL